MKQTLIIIMSLLLFSGCRVQHIDNLSALQKIEREGLENSQVMDILSDLVDVHSPRLSGSNAYYDGAKWVKEKMETWGCDVTLEPYDFPAKGWETTSFSVTMTSPRFETVIAQPAAWSGSTKGNLNGIPLAVDVFNLEQLKEYKGKLTGRILLHNNIEARLPKQETILTTQALDSVSGTNYSTESLQESRDFMLSLLSRDTRNKEKEALIAFLKAENVGAVLLPSIWDNHVLEVSSVSFQDIKNTVSVPFLIISKESSVKILHMIAKNVPPILNVQAETVFYDAPQNNVNIIADIKGTDPKIGGELVIAGAHFDTWQGSGNASDNNAGVAIIMEAFRILKTLGLKPKRTIRAGFWGGEEQIFYGSVSYLKNHIGDISTSTYKPEHKKITAYYNIDSGGGAIRSFFTQGNKEAQKLLAPWVKDFKKWGLEHISSFPSGGSDHMVFNAANIPSFDTYQDPSLYWSHQHHTNIDEIALIDEKAMKQNAIIMATFIYKTAIMDAKMPRN